MIKLFIASLILSFSSAHLAEAKIKKHEHKKLSISKMEKDKIVFKVNGMVCAFCAQGIEKNFNKQKKVKETKVNLDKMEVTVFLNQGKTLSEKKIKKTVRRAGFAFDGFKK